jgi:hypothetical protein
MLNSIISKFGKFRRQLKEARAFGKSASLPTAVSLGMLGLWYGFSPLEYYLYGFDGENRSKRNRLSYLPNERIIRNFRAVLNNGRWIPILENKLLFYLYFSRFNLPVIKVLGFYHPNGGFSLDGSQLNDRTEFREWLQGGGLSNLVVKPVGALGGKGIMIFNEFLSADTLRGNDGQVYTLDDILEFMDGDIRIRQQNEDPYRGFLIEEKVIQDPVMNVLSGASLNTVRISTLMTKGGEAILDFAMLRVGNKDSLTDNLHQGGFVVNIDTTNGSLGERTYGYRGKEGPWVEEKPVKVNELFKGGVVPFWQEMAELAKRAAGISPELKTVGWDIALSRNGPVLMEGNDNWDMVIAQVLAGGYLTRERREILREYGMEFPA